MKVIRCESGPKLITPNSQPKTQNTPPPNSIANLQFKTPMLLCPRCQFENPDPNKFCQQCGNSLIYKLATNAGPKSLLAPKNVRIVASQQVKYGGPLSAVDRIFQQSSHRSQPYPQPSLGKNQTEFQKPHRPKTLLNQSQTPLKQK